jgi:K+-sensing histidine kinase KdpD
MNNRKFRQSLLYILFLYVLIQLFWWGYQLLRNYQVIYGDNTQSHYKIWMIIGEGSVFSILLFLGFRWIHQSMKKEMESAVVEKTFLLSVTHELKTPIASIRLMLDTLTKRKTEEEQQKLILGQAQGELTRLQKQIENILLTSRTSSGRFENQDQIIHLEDFISAELTRLNKWYPHHQFEKKIDPSLHVNIDPEFLNAILFNLIDNACKYSPVYSTVSISAQKGNAAVTIQIQDEGEGLPTLETANLTQKFFRGSQHAETISGSGLGLYLVQNIVKFYKGKIQFKRHALKGTIVTVTLPL